MFSQACVSHFVRRRAYDVTSCLVSCSFQEGRLLLGWGVGVGSQGVLILGEWVPPDTDI